MVASEPSFTDKFQAGGLKLSVNGESATEFAMKYVIGEILFLEVRLGDFSPVHIYVSYHSRKSPRR